jgi:DNA-binding winged helix-turn-helix (wHTH) protein/TolB-like protein/Tfp pilus assembly protein PilF
MSNQARTKYEFGPFCVDPSKRLLSRDGENVALTPKSFDILLTLIESCGEVVTKDYLIKRVWPDTYVEEGNLTYNISVLRKALGERAGEHQYIVTVPGRGYQFVASVSVLWPESTQVDVRERPEFRNAFDRKVAAREPDDAKASQQQESRVNHVDDVRHSERVNVVTRVSENTLARIGRHKLLLSAIVLTIVALISAWRYLPLSPRVQKRPISRVAVLPLINSSDDPDMEYLSEGISESIINSLSQLPGLEVIARSSSFKFKSKDADPQEVARVLGVEGIVTGRVLQRGDQLQISIELIDARVGTQVWGNQYNRSLAGLLQVQSDICREIADQLRLPLTRAKREQLARHETTNPLAYELLLRGGFYARKGGTENRIKGIGFFEQAISIDPQYASAYAQLSMAYGNLGLRPKAQAAAQKALELDESLAEAHVALANLYRDDWDWTTAEAKYKHAIELNPNLMRARVEYSDYLSCMGLLEQSLEETKRARELDPLNTHINNTLGMTLYLARRYDEALIQAKKTLELDDSFLHAFFLLGVTYTAKGMYPEAINAFQELSRLDGMDPITQVYFGAACASSGERGKARAILKRLETGKEYISQAELAVLYTSVGEREKAFASLEKAYAAHDPQLQYLKVTPDFDPLRSDPRFADLMRRVGLP